MAEYIALCSTEYNEKTFQILESSNIDEAKREAVRFATGFFGRGWKNNTDNKLQLIIAIDIIEDFDGL